MSSPSSLDTHDDKRSNISLSTTLRTPKSLSLSLLVVINVILVFSISYSRSPYVINRYTKTKLAEHNSLYLTSTAVAVSEVNSNSTLQNPYKPLLLGTKTNRVCCTRILVQLYWKRYERLLEASEERNPSY